MFENQELLLIKTKLTITVFMLTIILATVASACSGEAPGDPQPPQQPAPAAPAMAAPVPLLVEPSPPEPPAAAQPADPAIAPVQSPSQPLGQTQTRERTPRSMPTEPTPIPAVFPLTVQSADGREIVFEEPPERIVAFDSAVVEMLFAMGEGHRVVATHDFVTYPPESANIARVGNAFDMNIEATVELEPDLVYMFFDRFNEDLERAGLKLLYIPTLSDDFTKVADNIRLWGRIVGNPNAAEKVALDFESKLEYIEEVMDPIGAGPSVFQDAGSYWTPGRGTLIQEVFDLLRLENIAADIEGYAQISPEIIVARDPNIIITSSPDTILSEPALSDVWAVRNGAFYTPSSDALSIPGPRFIDGVEERRTDTGAEHRGNKPG